MTPTVTLLGPQSLEVTLGRVFPKLKIGAGPVATVTAGWQEREDEVEELDHELAGGPMNLRLYARAERVFAEDPDLSQAHRKVQRRLKDLRRLYNIRLSSAMDTFMALLKEKGDPSLIEPERAAALETLRELDAWHLKRIEEIRSEFEAEWTPSQRDSVVRERGEIEKILRETAAVVVTGGHVAVLLNRLRLFDLAELLRGKNIVAWSAGAMALSERIVLFHDSPPQGPGHAEVFESGLGLFRGVVPLPHGRTRLRLEDEARVARFAQRFLPDACVLMDAGTCLHGQGGQWSADGKAEHLSVDGSIVAVAQW